MESMVLEFDGTWRNRLGLLEIERGRRFERGGNEKVGMREPEEKKWAEICKCFGI
jgi:hypothetical protein